MYLMIEDDEIIKNNVCSENDKKDADNYFTILIDIDDKLNPMQYYQGAWHQINGFARK